MAEGGAHRRRRRSRRVCRAVRIAFVRGANLNPWELQNYAGLPGELVAFASRSGGFGLDDVGVPVRRLPSVMDAARRLPRSAAGAIMRLGGCSSTSSASSGPDRVRHRPRGRARPAYSAQAMSARDAGRVPPGGRDGVGEHRSMPAPENRFVARRIASGRRRASTTSSRSPIAPRPPRARRVFRAERITVLPMGIDLERFPPSRRCGRRRGPLRILAVGRLVWEKGIEDMVLPPAVPGTRGARSSDLRRGRPVSEGGW